MTLPSNEMWNATTTRAARLALRVLIVAGSHVELIDADTGRVVSRVGPWGAVAGWLEEAERMQTMRRAA